MSEKFLELEDGTMVNQDEQIQRADAAYWTYTKKVLSELQTNDYSREHWENLKNSGLLNSKVSFEMWSRYWAEYGDNNNGITLIEKFFDKLDLARRFIKICPIYYESKKRFWVWNFEKFVWEIKDETDILNLIFESSGANTINSRERGEILEALKQVGRKNKPKEIKKTWVQFQDIFYDIESGKTTRASPKYFCSNPMKWKIGESEETPRIDKLIKSWVSEEDVEKLYELIAFSIIPDYFIHSFFFLYSKPGSGKSTFVNLLIDFLGKNNCSSTSIDRINNNVRFETLNWNKKLLITMSEVSNINDLKNSGLINQATGQDTIRAEIKGGDTFDFVNYGKFIYPTNKLLKVSSDDGFGRRVRVIKFTNRFEKEKDVLNAIPEYEFENLAKKSLRIAKELWVKRQFTGDVSISERMKDYQEISKTDIEVFIDKFCNYEDVDNKISFNEFYLKYSKYNKDCESKNMIGRQLRKLGYIVKIENWKVWNDSGTEFQWESGMKISGISWKEKQNSL